jgi:hypothetical protein
MEKMSAAESEVTDVGKRKNTALVLAAVAITVGGGSFFMARSLSGSKEVQYNPADHRNQVFAPSKLKAMLNKRYKVDRAENSASIRAFTSDKNSHFAELLSVTEGVPSSCENFRVRVSQIAQPTIFLKEFAQVNDSPFQDLTSSLVLSVQEVLKACSETNNFRERAAEMVGVSHIIKRYVAAS